MKENYTHIGIVIDRSSSMFDTAKDTRGGINRIVEEQKNVPGECSLGIFLFATNSSTSKIYTYYECIYQGDIQNAPKITDKNYSPNGMTPYYDCAHRAIVETGKFLADKPEEERPGRVVFVIATDGENNASVEVSKEQLRALVKEQTEKYSWEFVFIGANINAEEVAKGSGISAQSSLQWTQNPVGTSAVYDSINRNLRNYRGGQVKSMAFTDEDRKKQKEAEELYFNKIKDLHNEK